MKAAATKVDLPFLRKKKSKVIIVGPGANFDDETGASPFVTTTPGAPVASVESEDVIEVDSSVKPRADPPKSRQLQQPIQKIQNKQEPNSPIIERQPKKLAPNGVKVKEKIGLEDITSTLTNAPEVPRAAEPLNGSLSLKRGREQSAVSKNLTESNLSTNITRSTKINTTTSTNGNNPARHSIANGKSSISKDFGNESPVMKKPPKRKKLFEDVDTAITIPTEETPFIIRNKEMRRSTAGTSGTPARRRSSLGTRGKRASSAHNGMCAPPHPWVDSDEFFRHIDADQSEPIRMRQLMMWSAHRALEDVQDPERDEPRDPATDRYMTDLYQHYVKEIQDKTIELSWYFKKHDPLAHSDEKEPPGIPKPNPRLVKEAEEEDGLKNALQRWRASRAVWTTETEAAKREVYHNKELFQVFQRGKREDDRANGKLWQGEIPQNGSKVVVDDLISGWRSASLRPNDLLDVFGDRRADMERDVARYIMSEREGQTGHPATMMGQFTKVMKGIQLEVLQFRHLAHRQSVVYENAEQVCEDTYKQMLLAYEERHDRDQEKLLAGVLAVAPLTPKLSRRRASLGRTGPSKTTTEGATTIGKNKVEPMELLKLLAMTNSKKERRRSWLRGSTPARARENSVPTNGDNCDEQEEM
ncbi:Mis12-Mtw1 protein family-domain-containing protein [Cladochytrium replicatum]|nr:Mis12-Mtw1 protein family-domain-containing protein [Cladochytrium replicatum]